MIQSKKQQCVSYVIFGIYFLLLICLILFKFDSNLLKSHDYRSLNLIPFHGSLIVNGRIVLSEIIYNILVFVPFGVYIGIFKPEWSFARKVLPTFAVSVLFEAIQYIGGIGASDITDVIGNTLGGIIGIVLFIIFRAIYKKKCVSIINIIGGTIEALAIVMLILIDVGNV